MSGAGVVSTLFTGLRMLKSEIPGTYTYQTGTNKLAHIEGTPPIDYGYDVNGNITTENAWTYVYDLSNQLVTVLNNSNQVAAYTYNGAGQRIKKVTQTETRIFHYDLRGHLIAETNQSGQMLAEYVYLGEQLLAMIRPGEVLYYFHNDHLGTPQVLTNDSQAIAWKAVYTPFGEAVPSIQMVENPFRFPGQYYDQETGLHYNYFRYYNPQTGRYITPDPIGLEGGINLFVYVQSNPINEIDPQGQQTTKAEKIIGKIKVINKVTGVVQTISGVADCFKIAKKYNDLRKECEKLNPLPELKCTDISNPYCLRPLCETDTIALAKYTGGTGNLNYPIEQCMKEKARGIELEFASTCGLAVAPGVSDVIEFVLP